MSSKDDHRDLMMLTGRRLAHEDWRARMASLRTRVNCAWAHLSAMLEEADLVLSGWDGMDKIRWRYRQIRAQVEDIGYIAAGGHAEHAERGTVSVHLRQPAESRDTDDQHQRSVPLLAFRQARWLSSDLAGERGEPA